MSIDPTVLNTVDQVMALAKRFEAITKLAEVLREIGSLDQAARETEERHAKLTGECEREQGRLDALTAQSVATGADIVSQKKRAQESADVILTAARREGSSIVLDSQVKAAGIAAAAKVDVDRMIGSAGAQRDHLLGEVNNLKKQASDLSTQIVAQQHALELVTEKVERARAAARREFGG